jgi:hypothetical protein
VVVLGRQQLVALPRREAPVDEAQPHRGRVRERDVVGMRGQEAGDSVAVSASAVSSIPSYVATVSTPSSAIATSTE